MASNVFAFYFLWLSLVLPPLGIEHLHAILLAIGTAVIFSGYDGSIVDLTLRRLSVVLLTSRQHPRDSSATGNLA